MEVYLKTLELGFSSPWASAEPSIYKVPNRQWFLGMTEFNPDAGSFRLLMISEVSFILHHCFCMIPNISCILTSLDNTWSTLHFPQRKSHFLGKVPKNVISAGAEIMTCEQIDKQSVAWEPLKTFLHISVLKFWTPYSKQWTMPVKTSGVPKYFDRF